MNENVTLIPARIRAGNRITRQENKPKLRVVAYCRVSTDSDEQAGSYDVQVQHYTEYIGRNKEWELAGIYTDDGISGTNIKKREGFIEMIDDCMEGKVDMIITKSISRFARNTIDCLKYVRKLKEKNIAIVFEKENINTLEASGELLLTIMASLAQQESASLSQNIKLGLQFRYQEGKVQVNHEHFLGYTKDEYGKLIVDEDEAKIVRRIFREYLEGASFRDIANGLEKDKIMTGGKRYKWHLSTIRGILRNEKYMGDALLQKTITTDFIEKIRIKNDGTVPQYYVKDSQEPIIARDIFMLVQEEMTRRANLTSGVDGKKKRVYSSKYALSSICTCTKCGDIYRRIAWNNRGKKSTVWRCCTRVEHGPSACDALTIQESELEDATVKAINKILICSDRMLQILRDNIEMAIADDNSVEMEKLNGILMEKQKELVKLAHAKKDYTTLVDEIDIIRDKKHELQVQRAETEGVKKRIGELTDFLKGENHQLIEYDECMVRKYIEEIKVYEDKFTICFKAKVEIDIER
ncbi:TPA: recombinase family protein [Streptococcus pyogenes]